MTVPASDAVFGGSIPEIYDGRLVPLIFQPYAEDLARRSARLGPTRVLETAAGTGVVTRALARSLVQHTRIVATDLNAPMLDRAALTGSARPVQWQVADAQELPFEDGAFDLVVCQFGAMFFPDRVRAHAQARRVLRPGGWLLFNVWDRIEDNEFAHVVTQALAERYPADPPAFLARTPHGYFDPNALRGDLQAAGYTRDVRLEIVVARSRAASALEAAAAYCQGTPLRSEIEARDPQGLAAATEACAQALARRFGMGPVDGKIQAVVVAART